MPVVAAYPTQIPVFTAKVDDIDTVFADHINILQAEVRAIASALGTLPAGTASSVKARIAAAEDSVNTIAGRFNGSGLIPQAGVVGLVDALASLAGSGAVLTAWTPFTPVVRGGGTPYTFAAGVAKGAYKIVGKTMFINISVSTWPTGGGSAGAISVDLPGGITTVDRVQIVPFVASMLSPPTGYAQSQYNHVIIAAGTNVLPQFNIISGDGTGQGLIGHSNNLSQLFVSGVIEIV